MTPRAADPQTRVRVALPDDATAPLVARRALRQLLRGWRLPGLVEPVALVVSELVTNALRHGGKPIRLTVRRSRHKLSVGVFDSSPVAARRREARSSDESGRGMAIVETVASDTGTRPADPGKVVWAAFDIEPNP